jgi:ribosomal protein S12 methylthiotransferase
MAAQQTISSRRLQRKVGKVISVLVDATDGTGGVGRSTGDSPEIDGKVFLRGGNLAVGMIIEAEVERAGPYDLWARPIGA